jgi:hypothetical protein
LYWPLLIVLWGVAKLLDHLMARAGEQRPSILSGGEAALLMLLACILGAFVFRDWVRKRLPDIVLDWPAFGPEASRNENLPAFDLPHGARLAVETNVGDIKVMGTGDRRLRVSVRERAHGHFSADNERNIVIDHDGDTYRIHPAQRDWGRGRSADLEIVAPEVAALSMTTTRGDLSATGMAGAIRAAATDGNIIVHRARGDVSADLQGGGVRIDNVLGNAEVHGRGDDITVGNVAGDAIVEGNFLGDIRLHNVKKAVQLKSLRSELSATALGGDLSVDAGDISISGVADNVKLSTRDKDIRITNATGEIEIVDTHGDVHISYSASPQHNLSVTNDSGDIEITVPADAYFELSAVSHSGDIECDFVQCGAVGDNGEGTDGTARVVGTFGTHKGTAPVPRLSAQTSYGTIYVRKSK